MHGQIARPFQSFRVALGIVAAIVVVGSGIVVAQEHLVVERFDYVGSNESTAVKDGVAAFVEKVVSETLGNPTRTADREAIDRTRREVLARSDQLVTRSVLTGPVRRPGGFAVGLRVEIDRAEIRRIYQAQVSAAANKPRYSIMVLSIEEQRRQRPEGIHVSHEIRPDSKVGTAIRKELTDQNFKVYDANRIADIQAFKLDKGKLEKRDAATLARIAHAHGADIVLVCYAKADGPAPKIVFGRQFYEWHATATAELSWSDTADEIGAAQLPEGWSRMHEVRDAGAEQALAELGGDLAKEVVTLLRNRGGRVPEIKLTIQGVPSFTVKAAVSDFLASLVGAPAVRAGYQGKMIEGLMATEMTTDELALKLESWRDPAGRYRIVVMSTSPNAIEAELQAQ